MSNYSKQKLTKVKIRLEGAGWYNVRIALPENSPLTNMQLGGTFKGNVQRVLWWSYAMHLGYTWLQ
jgi:hypothetical protein